MSITWIGHGVCERKAEIGWHRVARRDLTGILSEDRNDFGCCALPYCGERSADSRDHVFPQFLGGRATILAGTPCNRTFGHSFEGRSFKQFKNWMLVFRRSGMPPPYPMKWERVALDVDGKSGRYDIDQDLRAVPSVPVLERDDEGRIVRVSGDRGRVTEIVSSLIGRPLL